ncbi:hypothetical protein [Mycetocola sp. 2940]|uniref:hypothetical protein n=1 Tax=Mycetocola sp. 2940 TaxID=3156452 RepID=UPI00339975C7
MDASDFVLELHRGVTNADRTLRDYVVTDAIAASMDDALGLVSRTVAERQSKGAFIHGSFGSGKSHFMAVLHLLLSGNIDARKLDLLGPVVDKHRDLLGRNLLTIDYHLLGAGSFEEALFGGYVGTITALHPAAPAPMLHVSDGLLQGAASLRAELGDDKFFAALNGGKVADDGWGDLAIGWTAETYEQALREGKDERARLVTDLVGMTIFQGFAKAGEWLSITDGITAMTEHAKSLGYDGIVLFLDELVLWLGQHLADSKFIQSETSKVAKLVETGMGTLPVPIVSFIARQRDLQDFLGEGITGAEREGIGQSFAHWNDRFDRIDLQAADLPKIVNQRLLRPVSPEAGVVLSQAVDRVKSNTTAWTFLMTDEAGAGEAEFAQVYPFSPALVDAMIALSSIMQRERTALKLMGELLDEGRDELTASTVIPVGDLYDRIMTGNSTPLSSDQKQRFAISKQFYETKLRPYLLNKHSLGSVAEAKALKRGHAFHTEDRLAKTLLIADLAPGTTSLKNLTASKLAALNYGTVNSMIAGMEAMQVVTLVKEWSRQFGEIKLGDGNDPLVAIHLSGVDYDAVLERVVTEDNAGNRQRLIRSLVAAELGLTETGGMIQERRFTHIWRGRKQIVNVKFGNVRDETSVSDDDLIGSHDAWTVVIDYPFDEVGYSNQEDLNRLDALRDTLAETGGDSRTIVWIPNFLTTERLTDVGTLAKLDHVLKPANFEQNAVSLPAADRELARIALENQRESLTASTLSALRQAYAVSTAKQTDIDARLTGTEVFSTVFNGLTIQPPVADNLAKGLQSALEQAWTADTPTHPEFLPGHTEVKAADLRRVVDLIGNAVAASGRLEGLPTSDQALLKRIAVPLGLGVVSDNVLIVGPAEFPWRAEFARWAQVTADQPTVAALRAGLRPAGIVKEVQNTLILAWALITDREWVRDETVLSTTPSLEQVPDELVLRPAGLPTESDWMAANERAKALFNLRGEAHLYSTAVRRLGVAISDKARTMREAAAELVKQYELHAAFLGLDASSPTSRLATARRTFDAVQRLGNERTALIAVEQLAVVELGDLTAAGRSLQSAGEVARALQGADWGMLSAGDALTGAPTVANAMERLRAAVRNEESIQGIVDPLIAAVAAARTEVMARMVVTLPPAVVQSVVTRPVITDPDQVPVNVIDGNGQFSAPQAIIDVAGGITPEILDGELQRVRADILAKLALHPGSTLTITWRVE